MTNKIKNIQVIGFVSIFLGLVGILMFFSGYSFSIIFSVISIAFGVIAIIKKQKKYGVIGIISGAIPLIVLLLLLLVLIFGIPAINSEKINEYNFNKRVVEEKKVVWLGSNPVCLNLFGGECNFRKWFILAKINTGIIPTTRCELGYSIEPDDPTAAYSQNPYHLVCPKDFEPCSNYSMRSGIQAYIFKFYSKDELEKNGISELPNKEKRCIILSE